jgi:hypothetical protein
MEVNEMKPRKTSVCITISAVILIGTAGCFPPQVNDLINGGMKLASGQVGALTAGELKAVSDAAIGVIASETGQTIALLTTEQAQALVTFLDLNGIETFDDFNGFAQRAAQDPGSIQGLDQLAQAFGQTGENFDPSQLESLFQTLFGGAMPSGPDSGPDHGIGGPTGGDR